MKITELGIDKSKGMVANIFDKLNEDQPFESISYEKPHEFINYYWQKYMGSKHQSNNINQSIFRHLIYTLLYREGILPFYIKAKVAFVPNIVFDTIIYSRSSPICLSMKTSLKKIYKRADLEAIALKYVHPKAKSYLLTLESEEAQKCKEKVKSGDIIGLDGIIDCNSDEINDLIGELQKIKDEFTESKIIEVVTGILINRKYGNRWKQRRKK